MFKFKLDNLDKNDTTVRTEIIAGHLFYHDLSAQASFFAGSKDSDDVVEHAVMAGMHNKMVAAASNIFMSYLRPSCRNEPLCCWCGLYRVCLFSENNINRFLFDYKRGKEKTGHWA